MILRRVIEHFRKQEWTAIAIDFLIVVMGVFIGMQVNNWNAARAEAQQARAYMVELREDFRGNLALAESAAEEHIENIKAMLALLEISGDPAAPVEAAVLNAQFRRVQSMPTFTPITRTYDNIVGAGDLKIIRNRELEDALSRFNRLTGLTALVQNTHELELVNTFQPYIIANLDYAAVGYDRSAGEFALKKIFDEEGIAKVVNDREFRNVVVQKWTISIDLLQQARDIESEIRTILKILDAELQGRKDEGKGR